MTMITSLECVSIVKEHVHSALSMACWALLLTWIFFIINQSNPGKVDGVRERLLKLSFTKR